MIVKVLAQISVKNFTALPPNLRVVLRIFFGVLCIALLSQGIAFAQRVSTATFYLDNPEILAETNVHFSQTTVFAGNIYAFYQRIVTTSEGLMQSIAYRTSANGSEWSEELVLVSDILLETDLSLIPPIYSVAVNESELSLAVSITGTQTEVYTLRQGEWTQESLPNNGEEFIAPQMYAISSGIMLFGLRRTQAGLFPDGSAREVRSIVYAFRRTGQQFGAAQVLPVSEDQTEVINPSLLEANDQVYVAYESISFNASLGLTSQIYIVRSSNEGESWTAPSLVSNFIDSSDRSIRNISFENYVNQNPQLNIGAGGDIILMMDRSRANQNARVSISRLSAEGEVIEFRNQNSIYLSGESRTSSGAEFFVYRGINYVLYYFDALGQSRVFLASEGFALWNSEEISRGQSVNFLPSVVEFNSQVYFFWLQRNSPNAQPNRLLYRTEDRFVASPVISPINFTPGQVNNVSNVAFFIDYPNDPAGIQAIRYDWAQISETGESAQTSENIEAGESSQARENTESAQTGESRRADPSGFIEESITSTGQNTLTLNANASGQWRLELQIIDAAGNISEPVFANYDLDIEAPDPVQFAAFPLDASGFLVSNTQRLAWLPPANNDLSGYRSEFRFVLSEDQNLQSPNELRLSLQEGDFTGQIGLNNNPFIDLENAENGIWALIVSAVDNAGNESEKEVEFLRLNKFIPSTELVLIDLEERQTGEFVFTFTGRGYTSNGIITSIIFDQDGELPWDYVLSAQNGEYQIESDRSISNISLVNFINGQYQIILDHSDRGLYFHDSLLSLERGGAIKIGDYSLFRPAPSATLNTLFAIPIQSVIISIITVILIFVTIISLFRIRSILIENKGLEAEVRALVDGRLSPSSMLLQEKLRIVQRQGIGLRLKFTALVLVLVVAVVSVVSLPLSSFILRSQREVLVQGLEERIGVMVESLARGAVNSLQDNNILERIQGLGELNDQTSVMDEIEYFTVTAFPNPSEIGLDSSLREFVWFTSDPLLSVDSDVRGDYLASINEAFQGNEYFNRSLAIPAGQGFRPGVFTVNDSISEYIGETLIPQFNSNTADPAIAELVQNLSTVLERRTTGAAIDLQESIRQESILRSRLTGEIEAYISIGTEPQLSVENYDINAQYYTVYYPLYWIDENFTANYQGTIRLGITTESINQQIRDTQNTIIIQVLIFTAIAIVAGLAGALLLASITINPIKKLVTGVERIRDTEVKSELRDTPIVIKTRDELNFLSDTINQMTMGLIKAEQANKSLLLGKDVQKMFIALDKNPNDERTKATTRHEESDLIEFFGYYEGAKGVSGDYFYYQKIDDRRYAMIKCDVSGKDIEAALIMVTVATLFLEHFDEWQQKQIRELQVMRALKQNSPRQFLSSLVHNINSIIYERDFKGKFAALSLLVVDEQSGSINFCNAGDNVVNVYRRRERRVEALEFTRTPAAGAISEKETGIPINFPEEPFMLERGDILLLYTDGFEEARRYIRHADWEIHQEAEYEGEEGQERLKKLEEDIAPYILTQDEDGLAESFSTQRIHDVVEAVMKRSVYHLQKFQNPAESEELHFDFSKIESSLPNVILALMSVEKIFRLVPLPTLTRENIISVDKKIDEFLRKYFIQYSNYFHHPMEQNEASLYNRYCFISEDSQYDDLTILAVEKK